ncbi:hypothetical protein AAGG52_06280 [Bacillus licheniformis]
MWIMLFLLGACTEGRDFDAEYEATTAKEGGSGAEVIADRLDVPWTIAHTGEIFTLPKETGESCPLLMAKRSACSFS